MNGWIRFYSRKNERHRVIVDLVADLVVHHRLLRPLSTTPIQGPHLSKFKTMSAFQFNDGEVMALTEDKVSVAWWCDGCKMIHTVPVVGDQGWSFNGSLVRPTLSPSVLCTWDYPPTSVVPSRRCHIFIRDGVVEFLSDCTHDLAGKTVPLFNPNGKHP